MTRTPPKDAGPLQARLSNEDLGAFRTLVATAKSFTVGLHGLRASPSLGKGKLPLVKQALEELAVTPAALFVANRWMGSSSPQTLVLWATVSKDIRTRVLSLGAPWEAIGRWEDLALFTEDRVAFWSTSHESGAYAFGDLRVLSSLGLRGTPASAVAANLAPVEKEALSALGIRDE